jgi:hypothetical protein
MVGLRDAQQDAGPHEETGERMMADETTLAAHIIAEAMNKQTRAIAAVAEALTAIAAAISDIK